MTTVSVHKTRWRAKLRQMDLYLQNLVKEDLRGDLKTPITDYKSTAQKILHLAKRGEDLLERSVQAGLAERTIEDIRNLLNLLEEWSDRVFAIATRKWGKEPADWPRYKCFQLPTAELVQQSNSIRALDALLEGDE